MPILFPLAATLAFTTAASAVPNYGHDFVTIGNVNNPAYQATFPDTIYDGRGSVSYEYRIASREMDSGQYIEFANALNSARIPGLQASQAARGGFSAGIDPDTGLIVFFALSDESVNWPVRGMNWRLSAVYCNWLHNDKGSDPEDFLSGAYDYASFGSSGAEFTDQATRSPGAKYWIPSTDEWLKAVHYDPDKEGPGVGGWWDYSNGSDARPVTGLPGEGETSANIAAQIGRQAAWQIPVGAYADHTTPYGLLDASGGVSEWMEDWVFPNDPTDRFYDGHASEDFLYGTFDVDHVAIPRGSRSPGSAPDYLGIRIAAAVPAPGTVVALLVVLGGISGIRRRR